MIKIFTHWYLLFFFVSGFIKAQTPISLTREDLYGPIGTTLYMANDDEVSSEISIGDAGENKTWDFRGLVNRYVDTVKIMAASATPAKYASVLPQSDYVVYANETYTYLKDNGSSLKGYGFGYIKNGISLVEKYDTVVNIGFPILYSNGYTGTSYTTTLYKDPSFTEVDSVKISLKNEGTGSMDAWGTLMLPDSNYRALREKTISTLTETIYHKKSGIWAAVDTNVYHKLLYQWFAKGIGNELVAMDVNPETSKINVVQYRIRNITASLNAEADLSLLNIFPNPNAGNFTIQLPIHKSTAVTVYDATGKKVYNASPDVGTEKLEISLAGSAKGIYQVVVSDGQKSQCSKLIVY